MSRTEAQKLSQEAYQKTERGAESARTAKRKYKKTELGKAACKRRNDLVHKRERLNPDWTRICFEDNLRRSYGLTVHDYAYKRHVLQNNSCANVECNTLLVRDRLTHIDHCHACSTVRGILCHNCNLALGHVREDRKILNGLINYLGELPCTC